MKRWLEAPRPSRARSIAPLLSSDAESSAAMLTLAGPRAGHLWRSVCLLASVGALFLAIAILSLEARPGVERNLVWMFLVLPGGVLALRWQLRGGLAGALGSLGTIGLIVGLQAASTGHTDAARGALLASLALTVLCPGLLGWHVQRVTSTTEVQRLQAENKRVVQAAQTALQASEKRFRALVQNASDVITILDADGTQRYVSPSVARVLGYRPEELVGTSFFAAVHPDDVAQVLTYHLQRLADAASGPPFDFRWQARDGSWRRMEAVITNLLDDPSVDSIIVNARDITERKRFEEQLTHQAYHDPLTGLPNRGFFLDRLKQALARANRRGHAVAVLFLDLDRFKVINDSLGHSAGDALLVTVGQRIKDCVRPSDTIARLGGDEFTVLLEDIPDVSVAERAAEHIIAALHQPVLLNGSEVFVATSVGIACSTVLHRGQSELMQEADVALYRAKAAGRGGYVVFDAKMNARAHDLLDLETDLRRAVERGELLLHYQPVIDLTAGNVVGLEALVRWQHPRRGLILPEDFIPLAEETGLIVPIGRWVLQAACQQVAAWQAPFPAQSPGVISVNLSARQFQQPGLVDDIAAILRETQLAPGALELEITESAVMHDVTSAVATLQRLKQLGVQLAIDDFGTGYSSLNYLKRFPVDRLKIDRSFVDGLSVDANDAAIVRSVIALARSFNLAVTGEGIETEQQLACLQALRCDRGQGYLFARPLTAECIPALFATTAPLLHNSAA